MENILSKISIATLALTYLFFCGILYIMSFWFTFNFDITNYIDLLDIPKSFVYPLATGIGLSLILFILQAITYSTRQIQTEERINEELIPKIKELPTKTLLGRILKSYHLWYIIVLLACVTFYNSKNLLVIAIICFSTIVYFISNVLTSKLTDKYIKNKSLKIIFAILIIFIPIFTFFTGKQKSISIYNNMEYYTVTGITLKENMATDIYLNKKLISKLGNNLFFTTLDNKKIIILNNNEIVSIEFTLVQKRLN